MTDSLNVMVALSGGVDSAVAALRLVDGGHRVQALHMTNWEDDDGYCNAAEDYQDARKVCQRLGITLHRVNFSREYRDRVFAHFLAEIEAGRTPSPDILCNREIKFGVFQAHAQRLGAEWIATGHYARLDRRQGVELLSAVDANKDQTYFLHRVTAAQLDKALFPLGELTKPEVRALARKMELPVADKRDSTGICFIGERPFDEFLRQHVQGVPGPMRNPEGRLLGEHRGLPFYTLGQRQGLGLGGDAEGSGEPWYVVGKDMSTNTLTVAQGKNHPALFAPSLVATDAAWVNTCAVGFGSRCQAASPYPPPSATPVLLGCRRGPRLHSRRVRTAPKGNYTGPGGRVLRGRTMFGRRDHHGRRRAYPNSVPTHRQSSSGPLARLL